MASYSVEFCYTATSGAVRNHLPSLLVARFLVAYRFAGPGLSSAVIRRTDVRGRVAQIERYRRTGPQSWTREAR